MNPEPRRVSHWSMLATQISTGSQAVEKISLKVLIKYFRKTFFESTKIKKKALYTLPYLISFV